MDTDYSECPLSWNQHGKDDVDRDPLEDHHRHLEVDEIVEWTAGWIVVDREEDPTWETIVEDDGTIVVMIGDGMTTTRNAEEDRGAETDRIIHGVHRDRDPVPDREDLATKRRVHRRDTRNRGDIPLLDPARDRTEDVVAAPAAAVDPVEDRDRIPAASPRTAEDRRETSHRDRRMTAGEMRNEGTARIRTIRRINMTRATGRKGLDHRAQDPIRFTADLRPNHPRDPDREGNHQDEGTVMEEKRRKRMMR